MNPLGITLVILGALFVATTVSQTTNWCQVQSDYCWGEHIACEPNSFPTSTTCQNVAVLPMNSTLKNLILNRHNSYRQQIASGSNSKFPAAKQMSVMQWDDTLAFLAEKHVSHCSFQHDDCRATPQYPYSGQNLFYMATAGQYANATRAVDEGLEAWFEEWMVADANIVNSVEWEMWPAFHFSVMVNDQNSRVGCAMIQYNYWSSGWNFDAFMLTCNYEYTNMLEEPMYVTGTPCSQCTCSTAYPALCNA